MIKKLAPHRSNSSPNGEKEKLRFRLPEMKLQTRLIILVLLASIPVFTLGAFIINLRGREIIEQQAIEQLRLANIPVARDTATQLRYTIQILNQLAYTPDIISMDASRQKPILKAVNTASPEYYLVHTLNLTGYNVARSDDAENKDYSDRLYYQIPISGGPVTFQTVIGKTSGQPALTIGTAIHDEHGKIVGVVGLAMDLTDISKNVQASTFGETGYAYIVNEDNFVIAHPDATFTAELRDLSTYPPVAMLRQGKLGAIKFLDESGRSWHAYTTLLDNGWGVIVQQEDREYLQTVSTFSSLLIFILGVSIIVLLIMVWVIVRRAIHPVVELTQTATAIANGDLTRTVEVTSRDEFGLLADAFNQMTTQLRDLIDSLEQRVAERTKALATSTEVSRRLSTLLDQRQLVAEVVEQVQSAFGYYHAHIYLLDEASGDLVMAGGTGEAGQAMLAKGHKLPKGRGLVGRAAETNAPVLVMDVYEDPDWLPNPLLPETKAEVAIPISSGDDVLGVLDVQHNVRYGLRQDDVDLLQSLANQVAIALQNAHAYTEAQQRAEHEAQIAAISRKIQGTTSIESALQVAARELGYALDSEDIRVTIESPARSDKGGGNGTNPNRTLGEDQ